MIEFYWPSSAGEWLAWTSAAITIFFDQRGNKVQHKAAWS